MSNIHKISRLILLSFLAAGVIFSVTSCKKKEEAAAPVSRERVYAVVTQKAAVAELQDSIEINGEVDVKTNVAIYPEIGGKLVSLTVEVGDRVQKGQVIATVDPSKPGYSYVMNPVKSTISGVVTQVISRVGATLTTSTGIVTVGDIDNLVIHANIPERNVGELKKNLVADLFFPAYPDIPFKAHITWISPVVDPASRSKQIELTLDKRDSRINTGMFPKIKLYTTVYDGYIVVPDDAVVTRAGQDYVFVVSGDIARRVPVRKLITIDNSTIIAEGLSVGDSIVVDGMDVLVDGSKVNQVER
ncbi:MAG: efflux RND transporter periplasmic adaptor subunit [Spirochaetia bacterium]|jgi:multidrug efflux pump subunit AcrA (membrane-fusion protein)|nr:efflux RND transporter periplasmic adaptor subunit [Spirochaetia bacterium]